MQERRAKMQQTQEAVFRRNLNEQEYAAVSKAMSEMQSQKRVTVYKLDDKGQLERHMLTIGLSDGSNAQIIRGAKEGDTFVVRAATASKGEQSPQAIIVPDPRLSYGRSGSPRARRREPRHP
jgi:Fe2+ transport system protein FeoA